MKHILKPALSLFLIAAITTALLGFVFDLTKEPIESQNRLTRERTMREVLFQADSFRELEAKIDGSIVKVYEGMVGDDIIGYVLELSPAGYSDKINLMVGILREENQIAGMRILSHSETPGLGALAARPAFYERFNGLALNPLRVVKSSYPGPGEIQAITSATITTAAITDAVNEAMEWYRAYQGGSRR